MCGALHALGPAAERRGPGSQPRDKNEWTDGADERSRCQAFGIKAYGRVESEAGRGRKERAKGSAAFVGGRDVDARHVAADRW